MKPDPLDLTHPPAALLRHIKMSVLVSVAYYAGAEVASLFGTLSDKILPPFWPPNIILFCALLLTPPQRWWMYFLAALPAHVLAELGFGMTVPQLLIAFSANCLLAGLNALAIQKLLGNARWFGTLRRAAIYILITAIIVPAVAALGGAFVQILAGGHLDRYEIYWARWYISNALGDLTLAPFAIIVLTETKWPISFSVSFRRAEALAVALMLIAVCSIAFSLNAAIAAGGYLPTLLYLPLPLILWSAVRFGVKGASGTILIVSTILIWRTLNSPTLFIFSDVEGNVFALQVFLLGVSTPILLLGAAIEEAAHAERTARGSEERMAFVAATANLGLWRHKTSSNHFWATRHCLEMFGLPTDKVPCLDSFLSRIHLNDAYFACKTIRFAIQHGGPAETEFRIALHNKEIRWIAARARPEFDDTNQIIAIVGTFTDITQRKAAETEATLQRQEIAHLMRISMLGEISGSLAHELTQPLTAILSNAQAGKTLLARDAPNLTEISDVLDDIIVDDSRAGEVIHRLRELLKKTGAKTESVDLNDLIKCTLRLLHSEIINRRISINFDLTPDLPSVLGDPVQLQQILINLMMNAMDAVEEMSPSHRTITVNTIMTSDGEVEVGISDHGPGLPTADRQQTFQPFHTTKERGLGLGLSICSSIIKSHGGTLTLQNNPIEGATASIRLPSQKS